MRRVVLDSLMSLDGYYTDSKNQIDWFPQFDEEDFAWSHDVLTRAGLLAFGRTTYEEFSKFFPTVDPVSAGWDPYIPKQLNELPKIVFSTSLKEAAWKPSTIVRTDPAKEIARLKNEPGKDIVIIGSGSIVSEVVRYGLVDEFRIRVLPIILGAGKPLLKNQSKQLPLKLVEAKTFKSGVQALYYIPKQ